MSDRSRKLKCLRVPCPKCGAYEWRMCFRKNGEERKSFHQERHDKFNRETKRPWEVNVHE